MRVTPEMFDDMTLDELAVELFRIFSRTEYALKASGFHNGPGDAKADWSAFARELTYFVESPPTGEVRESIAYMLGNPPNKQIINADGTLQWNSSIPKGNNISENLFVFVRRVRNNLFHGGKFNDRWLSPTRSELLIRHCLVILVACIEEVPRVRDSYHLGTEEAV